jgi:hypothetical protein
MAARTCRFIDSGEWNFARKPFPAFSIKGFEKFVFVARAKKCRKFVVRFCNRHFV